MKPESRQKDSFACAHIVGLGKGRESQRRAGDDFLVIVANFTPVVREQYRIGVPAAGPYRELLNSDSRYYGGSDVGNSEPIRSQRGTWMGQPHSLVLTLPPLGLIILKKSGET